MEKRGERDLSSIDPRTIAPEQWEAATSEIVRRARAERAAALRALFQRLRCWWQSRRQQREPVVRTYDTVPVMF